MSAKGFTYKQLKAIEMLARPDNELSLQQIADEVGVNQSTLWRWRRDENFQKAVTELAYSYLKDELPSLFKSLASKAIGGNVKAMELMLKYAGNYVEKIETKVSGDLDLGGMSDDELDRQIKEQERLLKLAEGKE